MRKNCSRTCPATCSTSSFNIFQLLSYPMDPHGQYAHVPSPCQCLHYFTRDLRPSDCRRAGHRIPSDQRRTIYELRKTRAVLRSFCSPCESWPSIIPSIISSSHLIPNELSLDCLQSLMELLSWILLPEIGKKWFS